MQPILAAYYQASLQVLVDTETVWAYPILAAKLSSMKPTSETHWLMPYA
jgi:hypothetical protein